MQYLEKLLRGLKGLLVLFDRDVLRVKQFFHTLL